MKIAKNPKEKKIAKNSWNSSNCSKLVLALKFNFLIIFRMKYFKNIFWRKNSTMYNPTILSKLYFWSKIRLLEKCKITKWVPKVLFVYTLKKLCLHSTVVNCIFQITDALTFLHTSCRYVHRNVCPHSIFVTRSGNWKLGGLEFIGKFLQKNMD